MSLPATTPRGRSEAPGVHPRRLWSLRPRSDRQSGDAIVSNFLLHWFPAKVEKSSLDWSYSFWLGTVSAALLLLLVLSGGPLLFLYVPSVERAYGSVKDIEFAITFGSWIRSVHRIAAHLMVAAVFLHMVRVFLTGAYKNGVGQGQHREWNWVIGVVMLLLTGFVLHFLPRQTESVAVRVVTALPVPAQSILLSATVWLAFQVKSAAIQKFIYLQF
jgi:quinol-cytochrome oxidoreductase complex cytochrome b subunit